MPPAPKPPAEPWFYRDDSPEWSLADGGLIKDISIVIDEVSGGFRAVGNTLSKALSEGFKNFEIKGAAVHHTSTSSNTTSTTELR